MELFSTRTDATVTPASVKLFAIYDPSLSHSEEDSDQQIVVFIPSDVDVNTKTRKVGLLQGIFHFCDNYTQGAQLNHVALEDGYVLYTVLESRYHCILQIECTRVEDDDGVEYRKFDIAPVNYLHQLIYRGYDHFRLHHGTIQSLWESMSRDECTRFLTKWWHIWTTQLDLHMNGEGILKLTDSYRRSQLRFDSEVSSNVDVLREKYGFKDFLVWDPQVDNVDEFGLIYEHSKKLQTCSKVRLLHWLEELVHYGITSESLTSSNIITQDSQLNKAIAHSDETIYDPFKMVLSTINDVSSIAGITAGVNTGIKAMSQGVEYLNGYLPWGKGIEPAITDVVSDKTTSETPFLIGSLGEAITYKNVYLQFEDCNDEKLYRIVIFKSEGKLIILIFEFNVNTLNELQFYSQLAKDLEQFTRGNRSHASNVVSKKRHLHYILFDTLKRRLDTNLPMILSVDKDDEHYDVKHPDDLENSRMQSIIVHRELANMFQHDPEHSERLIRTKNGWWCYETTESNRKVIIIKRWHAPSDKRESSSNGSGILDSSTDMLGSIALEAKLLLERFT